MHFLIDAFKIIIIQKISKTRKFINKFQERNISTKKNLKFPQACKEHELTIIPEHVK